MQRVTNCVLRDGNRVLLLRKPRRGWWVAPGGKMEPAESVTEAVIREYREETGLTLIDPALRGVFTVLIEDGGRVVDEWMLFTFYAERYEGEPVTDSPEGVLAWHEVSRIPELPTAPGDQLFLTHIAQGGGLITGKFRYTPDYALIDCVIDRREGL